MSADLVTALIGLTGVIAGGALKEYFDRERSRKNFILDRRQNDYMNFLENIAALAQAPLGSEERRSCTARLIGTKGKIILSSSAEVIEALGQFSSHTTLASEDSYNDFCSLVAEMRTEVGGGNFDTFSSLTRSILFEAQRPDVILPNKGVEKDGEIPAK